MPQTSFTGASENVAEPPTRSANATFERIMAVTGACIGGLGLVGALLATTGLVTVTVDLVLVCAAGVLTAVMLVACLLLNRLAVSWLTVSLLLSCALAAVASIPFTVPSALTLGLWLYLSCLLYGLCHSWQVTAVLSVLTIAMVWTILLLSADDTQVLADAFLQSGTLYTSGVGIILAIAMDACRRVTTTIDIETDRTIHAYRVQQAARVRSAALVGLQSTLHNTAANTLIAAPVVAAHPDTTDLLATRAAHDLRRITSLTGSVQHRPNPNTLVRVDSVLTEITAAGARLGLAVVAPSQPPTAWLDPAAADAVYHAAEEALLNISVHAGTTEATIATGGTETAVTMTITDHGVGFDARHAPPQIAVLHDDVRVTVSSEPGQGTTVIIECPAAGPTPHTSDNQLTAQDMVAARALLVRTMATIIPPMAVITIALSFPQSLLVVGPQPVLGWLGAAIVILIVWGYRLTTSGRMPWWFAVLYILSIPTLTWLQGLVLPGCPAGARVGSAAYMMTFFLMLLTSRRVVVVVGFVTWLVTSVGFANAHGCSSREMSGIILQLSVILATIYFRAKLGQFCRTIVSRKRQAAELTRDTRVIDVRTATVSRVITGPGLQRTRDLLEGIANRQLDLTDPAVVADCEQESRFLRTILAIPVEAGPLAETLASVIVKVHGCGYTPSLNVKADHVEPPSAQVASSIGDALGHLIAQVPVESSAAVVRIFVSATTMTLQFPGLAASGVQAEDGYPMTVTQLQGDTVVRLGWQPAVQAELILVS